LRKRGLGKSSMDLVELRSIIKRLKMNKLEITKEFINQSIEKLNENGPRIQICLDQLSEEEIWKSPNKSSNSVGNLILHLCGNITQYIISSLGKEEDERQRDKEFSLQSGYSKSELMMMLNSTVNKSIEVISDVTDEALLQVRSVQGFHHSGIGIIIHVVEHYSYHTGQIAFWTKLLKDRDLGFYAGLDLNKKNEK